MKRAFPAFAPFSQRQRGKQGPPKSGTHRLLVPVRSDVANAIAKTVEFTSATDNPYRMARGRVFMKWALLLVLFVATAGLHAETKTQNEFNPRFEQVPLLWRRNLDSNLRWMVAREKKGTRNADIGVYADGGVWHTGARALVEALESAGVPCRVLDHSLLTPEGLRGLKVVVVPGGDAYYEELGAGRRGITAIREFVKGGGSYLGICAGAYLASAEVLWENGRYPYMLGLFNGLADDSVPGTPDWPRAGTAKLSVTDEGKLHGLAPFDGVPLYYQGGCCFRRCGDAAVLARYADKSAAVIERPFGKGRVILSGVHFERPAPVNGNLWAPPPPGAGRVLLKLLEINPRQPSRIAAGLYTRVFTPPAGDGQQELLALERNLRAQLNHERAQK
jgi:glutamine amidotransferase-like uncharacterized protein